MKISLITGKVIEIPMDKYLDLSEEEYEDFIQGMVAADSGVEINDPFTDEIPPELLSVFEEFKIDPLPDTAIDDIQKEIQDE